MTNQIVLTLPHEEEEVRTLFSIEAEEQEPESRGAKGGPRSRRGLESYRSGEMVHRCSIGVPVVYPLLQLLPADAPFSPHAKILLQTHDFYWVQLACSLLPARNFRFGEASLTITLSTSAQTSSDVATIFDMVPQQVAHTTTRTTTWSLAPDLKFVSPYGEIDISGSKREQTENTEKQHIFLTAFGFQEAHGGWELTHTSLQEIRGSYRLSLLVKKPKQTQVSCTLQLSATILRDAGWTDLVMRYFNKEGREVYSPEYPLC